MTEAMLEIRGLKTCFHLEEGLLTAVDDVDLTVRRNATVCLVGESGCGKSMTALSVMRLVPKPGWIAGGSMLFRRRSGPPVDLARLDASGPAIRGIRGRHIAMIFQEPMASLSPIHTVGNQIEEMILLHRSRDRREARRIAVEMLDKTGVPEPGKRIDCYPFQLSGGLRQRAMIAMALSCNPDLLIADEPTTALDVTIQAQILALMRDLQAQFGMAMLYITHNFGVIAQIADEVAVMYLGRIVEQADVRSLFQNPLHPYTRLLLHSVPRPGRKRGRRLDTIQGSVPLPIGIPPRCGFFDRCPVRVPGKCDSGVPPMLEAAPGHLVRCVLHGGKGTGHAAE
jgi:peptide/nickel transport system ATP-binding protein